MAIAGAGLLILAFPDFDQWYLAWFALVPLMYAVEREKASAPASFLTGWLFGTLFFFGSCWWLTYAPIHYAGFPVWLAYFLLLCVCLLVGLFPALFAGILSLLVRRFGDRAYLAAPFLWVFTEFLRYWLTGNNWNAVGYSQAFTWFTEQGLLPAQVGGVYLVGFSILVFNLLFASVFLARRKVRNIQQSRETIPVIDESDIVTLGLSTETVKSDDVIERSDPNSAIELSSTTYLFPIIGVVFLFLYVLGDYGKASKVFRIRNIRTLLAILLVPTVFSFFVWIVTIVPNFSYGRFPNGDTFIIAVQPNVPMSGLDQSKFELFRDKQIESSRSAFEKDLARYEANDLGMLDNIYDESDAEFYREIYAKKPKIVVLPESPMNFMYTDDREFRRFIGDFARENNVSVLFNSAEPEPNGTQYYNSAVLVGPDGLKAAQYNKIYLLPFGESVPPPLEGILRGFVGNFAYGRDHDLVPVGDAKAGIMICFESHFGALSRQFVLNGADVLIEMTNDGYLGPTPVLRQHLANAVFRAVETNRPVIRVTNVGITAYINERGRVLDEAPTYQEATRVWSVSKSDGSQTFYVKYGDWFAWLCTAVTLAMLLMCFRRKRPEPVEAVRS